jgi:hypothetical protein
MLVLGISLSMLPTQSRADVPTITAGTAHCTLGSCPLTLGAKDNGKDLIYSLGERITVVLNDDQEPKQELTCTPSGVLAPLAMAPAAQYPFYALQFEVKARGTCILHSGDFSVAIGASRFR